ncbi:MAG: methylmalonyl Co-A mutase-associated GTPase MeaB [Balneolales bacterium]|nr:methylmalonyl Co-A mutase-associated GTPase MeaB [Balneolales bacterium]
MENSTILFAEKIRAGKRRALAQAITLVESTLREDILRAQDLLQQLLPFTGKSLRIGITGVPGVGKSTFIESLGVMLAKKQKRLAVLAVDPSSPYTGGSILGDKTRMQELSRLDSVFIRPSPTGGTLGGVSRKTRESILLCEAAGYDVILVETVGVGQSEYEVASMVDFFLMLMLPNAGDSLQGIKRGIMELADLILVNKADEGFLQRAKAAEREYKQAIHFLRPKYPDYATEVLLCSALHNKGIEEAWEFAEDYLTRLKADGYFAQNRKKQLIQWTRRLTEELLLSEFWGDSSTQKDWTKKTQLVRAAKLTPVQTAQSLIESFRSGKD